MLRGACASDEGGRPAFLGKVADGRHPAEKYDSGGPTRRRAEYRPTVTVEMHDPVSHAPMTRAPVGHIIESKSDRDAYHDRATAYFLTDSDVLNLPNFPSKSQPNPVNRPPLISPIYSNVSAIECDPFLRDLINPYTDMMRHWGGTKSDVPQGQWSSRTLSNRRKPAVVAEGTAKRKPAPGGKLGAAPETADASQQYKKQVLTPALTLLSIIPISACFRLTDPEAGLHVYFDDLFSLLFISIL